MPSNPPMIAVSDGELADLRARLEATRWAEPWPVEGWEAGTDATELRRLVTHWARGYDWRAHEAAINALPSHLADLGRTARLDRREVPCLERLRRRPVRPLQRRLPPHPSLPLLVHRHDLHLIPAVLLVRPRPDPTRGAGRRSDGRRTVPRRSEPATAELGRAHVQRHALHADAPRRALRRPRGTRPAGPGHHRVLPHLPLFSACGPSLRRLTPTAGGSSGGAGCGLCRSADRPRGGVGRRPAGGGLLRHWRSSSRFAWSPAWCPCCVCAVWSRPVSGAPPIMRTMDSPPVRQNRTRSTAARTRKAMLSQVV